MSTLLKLGSKRSELLFRSVFLGFGVGSSFVSISLDTFLKETYAAPFYLQKNGFDVNVSDEWNRMLAECSDDLQIPILNPPTKLFHCIGYDNMHFGSTLSTVGALIGIPNTYTLKSVEDIDKRVIKIKGKPVDWDSPEGKQLLESFIMSDAAKKFGIAYELAVASSPKFYAHMVNGPLATLACIYVNNYFCDIFGLQFRPFFIKSFFYLVLLAFGVGIYFTLKDLSSQFCEYEAIDNVTKGGKDYVSGGIEYCDKILTRNKILRNIIIDGSSDYNSEGDVVYFFRKKHLPMTVVKKTLEESRDSKDDS